VLDYLLMGVMAIFWAGSYTFGKLAVSSVPTEMVAFLRFLVAGTVLLVITAIWQPKSLKLQRKDWLLVLGLGVTGVAGYNLLFFQGLKASLASDGGMIIPTLNPLLTLFAAPLILGEALTKRKLLGAGVSLVGQVLIFWSVLSLALQDPDRLRGDLLYVACAFCWSAYTIIGRIAAKRFTPLASTMWAAVAGTAMLAPFALWRLPGSTGYTPLFWGNVLYLALGATVGAFVLWSRGIDRLGASRAAVFVNLVPGATVALAAVMLGEKVGWVEIAGMLVVLVGVYVAGTRAAQPRPLAMAQGES